MGARASLRRATIGALLIAGLLGACGEETPSNAVHVLHADGAIGPVMQDYIDRGLDRAEKNSARLLIIELDTPGGTDTNMRGIVKRIEASKVPVVVYVSPPGGRAASAGTFITMAANIAVMAPNTSIGAASAVNSDGSDIEGTLGRKIENDAVAFIRGIAELRGRNADWAEQAVRDAVAVNQTEAVKLNVVNFVANDRAELLGVLEGRAPSLGQAPSPKFSDVASAPLVETDMTVWERLLGFIADPTLASILITIGFLGLVFELANPGLIFPGVVGLIAMVLGFLGFGTLGANSAGLVLVFLGFVFLALELYLPSGGALGAGGAVSIVLGVIIAFRHTPAEIHPSAIVFAVLGFVLAGMFLTLAMGVARVARLAAPLGTTALVGKIAVARTPLAPEGYVFVQGERWKARVDRGTVQEGDRVRIVGAEGFRLRVHKEDDK